MQFPLSSNFIAAEPELGVFESSSDIGDPKTAGASTYDAATQSYTLAGAGTNMWLERDEFHLLYRRMKGDFILTTRAHFVGTGVDAHRKLGWIVRAGLDADAPHINAVVHGDGLTSLQFRRAPGATTEESKSALTGADVIQLERRGQTYLISVARFGEPFTTHQVELDLGDEVTVGLFVCSHNAEVVERAVFENVRVTVPTGEGFVPYRNYLGSHLEALEVESGARRIVYSSPECIEAPNWTLDGQSLIFNSKGRLYRFDLPTGTPEPIDTGAATRNNNDHVLSFDGQMLGISSAPAGGTSTVYTVPIQGGEPTQITPLSPSYLHGWSPDGEWLAYTGQRGGSFDIYVIPSRGGDEIRLTDTPGLDDGSEWSPDGQWIYFNSSRSGQMQLWRMKPDGSDQQQLTSDAYNNWFPHLSPDGQRILFLSYELDVKADSHPYYQPVMLRLMPIEGGEPHVVAYLYGGQGTINVPSWSPDGRFVAFVSNSG